MSVADLLQLAEEHLHRFREDNSGLLGPLKGLTLYQQDKASSFDATMLDPVIILGLKGRKEVIVGAERFSVSPGDCLLVRHDLPVTSRVTKAPYVALLLTLDLKILRDINVSLRDKSDSAPLGRSIATCRCDRQMLDAFFRYLSLAEQPMDERVLGPLILQELHYRAATSQFGHMLRDFGRTGDKASAIAQAIALLRKNFRLPVEIPLLARKVGMSESSFHRHFKEATALSPLQYRKELQLLASRKLLRTTALPVFSIAFEVGYESASQFSRDYRKKFGISPKSDSGVWIR